MKTKQPSEPKALQAKKHRLRKFFMVTGIILTATAALVGGYVFYLMYNPAENAAASFEKELVKNGGTIFCANGFSGHGSAYPRPTYGSMVQFNVGKEEAKQLVLKAARNSGFTLTPADSVETTVDRYSDNSKTYFFPGLETGPMELNVTIKNDDKPHECTGYMWEVYATLKSDETHTVVGVGVMLPYWSGRK